MAVEINAEIDMNVVKDDKKRLKQTLKDMTEFHANTIQFRKTYYVVSVYFKVPYYITKEGNHCSSINLTSDQRTQVEQTIAGLGLHYPVKVVSNH